MKEKSRMHQRVIQQYSDLHKRYTTRIAEFEASNKLRDETEAQLRHQLEGITEELKTSQQTVADKVAGLGRLRVSLREEAELYSDESAQDRHRAELKESLLLTESTRDLEATTKNYEMAEKKRQEAESDAQRHSSKLRKQDSTLEQQREDIRALQEDVDRLRDKYDEARDRSRDHDDDLSNQQEAIKDRDDTIQDLRFHTDRLKADLNEAEEATSKTKEECERLQLRFNELTVTNQMTLGN